MTIHTPEHPERPTNGAPQVVAVGFVAMVFFMLLLPLADITVAGTMEPRLLIQLLKTDTGFNVFALILLVAPIAGIAEALFAPSTWRITSAVIAGVAVLMVPLTLFLLSHRVHDIASGLASTSPGVGSYVLLLGYLILLLVTGIAAVRARHTRRDHATFHHIST